MTNTLILSRHARDDASAQSGIELPEALSRALREFGLTAAFHARTLARQRTYVDAVVSASPEQQQARIADILDELAQTSLLYFRGKKS